MNGLLSGSACREILAYVLFGGEVCSASLMRPSGLVVVASEGVGEVSDMIGSVPATAVENALARWKASSTTSG